MLADEEVAVVEGGGGERYDGLCELLMEVSNWEGEIITSLALGVGVGIVIFSSG
jgi:hypothetical protein